MAKQKVMGIYVIETKGMNKQRYIGMSQNIKKRWRVHRHELNQNKHRNLRLQKAWNEYGKDYFQFKIIQLCNSREEMCYFEKYYAHKMGYGNYDKCFNVGKPGIDHPFE